MSHSASAEAANPLEQLRQLSTVVADTGDIEAIARVQPTDATTNPSLVLAAAGNPAYQQLINDARAEARSSGAAAGVDQLIVGFGSQILAQVPRWVSTEVDARLSFDTPATIAKARSLIARYEALGLGRERVLIKIASTWEGIRAANVLEAEGIRCNMTLIFCLPQAVACAQAGVTLISPFVGRILDWHKAQQPDEDFDGARDPGVISVRGIHHYFRARAISTLVMGASFRNTGEIRCLAGCDLLTIAPKLMDALAAESEPLIAAIEDGESPDCADLGQLSESRFRNLLNDDAMASDRLADGIRRFAQDQLKLERLLAA